MEVRSIRIKKEKKYLSASVHEQSQPFEKAPLLLINSAKSIEFLKLDTIQLLEASGFKTLIHSESGAYCSGKPISNFEFLESFNSFFRVTRSYIVNADKIVKVENIQNSKGSIVFLDNGLSFELRSAAKCKELTDYLKQKYYFV